MLDRIVLLSLVAALAFGAAARVDAQATCPDTTGDACLGALRGMRGAEAVVDDVFTTSDGRFAPQLHFGRYVRGVNGCIGWTGWDTRPLADPLRAYEPDRRRFLDRYHCFTPAATDDVGFYADSLDWYWTQVFRTDDAGAAVADGQPGFYYPWRGRIYDLGGEANRVVVFPISDHGPLPCEAFEYSIWLTNDPTATEIAPEGAPDPNLWNPARLVRVFEQGWTRNVNAVGAGDRDRADLGTFLRDASSGDAVADSLVTVWALPCGLSFRYASVQGGNYGNPGPECTFHSNEDELDAVAGLNEDDTAICIDADGDGHRDAACGGSDCDDTDPARHPGAFERCDATADLDCQPMIACPDGTLCDAESGLCVPRCFEGGCAPGFACVDERCTDAACAARTEPCPGGTVCRAGACVAPCDGVVCPAGQRCTGGACIDPCEGVVCPSNQVCIARDPSAVTLCGPSCACTEISIPLCPTDTACDARPGSPTRGECVDPGCELISCGVGQVCRAARCLDGCEGVVCPHGQACLDGACVVDRCARIVCPGGQVCRDGECFDACDGVSCPGGATCRGGACVPDACAGVVCDEGERCVEGRCVGGAADAGGGAMDAGVGV
ncbi:MAG: putative metal-binding motif-containing protein, partial [Sandaracinaceae bacterium]|nr:putative metal-binding motif-containing protein [Sandaracinaceae bacterium]